MGQYNHKLGKKVRCPFLEEPTWLHNKVSIISVANPILPSPRMRVKRKFWPPITEAKCCFLTKKMERYQVSWSNWRSPFRFYSRLGSYILLHHHFAFPFQVNSALRIKHLKCGKINKRLGAVYAEGWIEVALL